jgi:Acyl-CoA dehydrogenase, C-terminal domain
VDFALGQEAEQLHRELTEWARRRRREPVTQVPDASAWRMVVRLGIFDIPDMLTRVVALTDVATVGLPGPLLEAYLAVVAGSPEAGELLEAGEIVTSVGPGPAGPTPVTWGAAARIVVDQVTGQTVARSALPPVQLAVGWPHGWWERPVAAEDDQLRVPRWIAGGALLCGLAQGALELARNHVLVREQFGRPIACYQAVQFPLAESKAFLEAAELTVRDAAWRSDRGDPAAEAAAALSWLWVTRASKLVADACHQAFGALGFCHEAGLIQLTYAAQWLRLSIGRRAALTVIKQGRTPTSHNPPCRVLDGFRVAAWRPEAA